MSNNPTRYHQHVLVRTTTYTALASESGNVRLDLSASDGPTIYGPVMTPDEAERLANALLSSANAGRINSDLSATAFNQKFPTNQSKAGR